MSASTATPTKADPYAELAAAEERFEQRLAQARQERAELGKRQRDYGIKLRTATAEYEALPADQFTSEGHPIKGSRAAKLRVVLDGAATSRLPSLIAASDRAVEGIEAERRAWMGEHAPALARRDREQRVAACQRIKAKARDLLAEISDVQGGYHLLVQLAAAVPSGAIDGRSIQTDPQLDELERLLSSLGPLSPPRIPAFTPYVDEADPGAWLTADNSWIRTRSAHQSDAGLADRQPERVERPA